MCPKRLLWILVLHLLKTVNGQDDEQSKSLQDLQQTCPESCPENASNGRCYNMDSPELTYQAELPYCKNITVKSSDFVIDANNNKLVLKKGEYQVSFPGYQLSEDKQTANICYSLSPQLLNCPLKLLNRRLYAFEESLLALKNCRTKAIVALGDFYELPDTKVIVGCREPFGYQLGSASRCEYVTLGPTEYEFSDNSKTVRVLSNNRTIRMALYNPRGASNQSIRLCFPLTTEMTKCHRHIIYPYEYTLEADHRLYVLRIRQRLELGQYKTVEGMVLYCAHEDPYTMDYYVSYYCSIVKLISAALITLAVVIHLAVPSINYHAKPLVCQMISMAVWYVAEPYRYLWYPDTLAGCYVIYVFLYFSALSSFFWLNVLAFDLWSIFANLQTSSMQLCANMCDKKPKFLLYCAYAYSIPLLMTILSLVLETQPAMQDALDLHPGIKTHCWFNEARSLYLFYSGPVFSLLCINMILFGLTVCNLRRASSGVKMVNKERNRQLFSVCIKIFVIMGLCWTIEFIVFLSGERGAAQYPAIIAASIQGILLFIIYICKPSTIRILRRKVNGTISSKNAQKTDKPKGVGHTNSTSSGITMESDLPSESSIRQETSGKKGSKEETH